MVVLPQVSRCQNVLAIGALTKTNLHVLPSLQVSAGVMSMLALTFKRSKG